MAITTTHPLYDAMKPKWDQMTDTLAGTEVVKSKTTKYLPHTSGMERAGVSNANQAGYKAYEAYKTRAFYYEFPSDSRSRLVGMMHREPAKIEVPDRLKSMLKVATKDGESLLDVLRKINHNQLGYGRHGILLEAPTGKGPDAVPYLALYEAPTITNWDSNSNGDIDLVVLDESGPVRDPVSDSWETKKQHRKLILNETYQVGVSVDEQDVTSFIEPQIAGKKLDKIPFFFINASDMTTPPGEIPLKAVSDLSLAVYRLDADYRQALFMQGQDTLVITGINNPEEVAIGANAQINLPTNATAEFIGVNGGGLDAMNKQLESDKLAAGELGSKLLDMSDSSGRASGDALRVRVASKTATLVDIARTGAKGLEMALKAAAVWVGADPEEVKVEPNLDFSEDDLMGQDLLNYMQSKALGAPISFKSLHNLMRKKDLTTMSWEEEQAEIDSEPDLQLMLGGGVEEEKKETPKDGSDSE
jgi:hypothetical protein